jgi:hypothetical protein
LADDPGDEVAAVIASGSQGLLADDALDDRLNRGDDLADGTGLHS